MSNVVFTASCTAPNRPKKSINALCFPVSLYSEKVSGGLFWENFSRGPPEVSGEQVLCRLCSGPGPVLCLDEVWMHPDRPVSVDNSYQDLFNNVEIASLCIFFWISPFWQINVDAKMIKNRLKQILCATSKSLISHTFLFTAGAFKMSRMGTQVCVLHQ